MKCQKCPVCEGRGIVHGGFYLTPKGISNTISSSTTDICRACDGNGVIYLTEDNKFVMPDTPGDTNEHNPMLTDNLVDRILKELEEHKQHGVIDYNVVKDIIASYNKEGK